MVDDVQSRHVAVFLSQNKEQSVEELRELGKVVPPTSSCHLKLLIELNKNNQKN